MSEAGRYLPGSSSRSVARRGVAPRPAVTNLQRISNLPARRSLLLIEERDRGLVDKQVCQQAMDEPICNGCGPLYEKDLDGELRDCTLCDEHWCQDCINDKDDYYHCFIWARGDFRFV